MLNTARRLKTTGAGPSRQIKTGKGDFGGGPQSYDGSENKGSPPYTPPSPPYEGPGKVIKTS